MRITIVCAWPRRARSEDVLLADAATITDAIAASGFGEAGRLDGIDGYAVFGERVDADHVLHDGDRVELLRPLLIDPKQARRRRAERSKR